MSWTRAAGPCSQVSVSTGVLLQNTYRPAQAPKIARRTFTSSPAPSPGASSETGPAALIIRLVPAIAEADDTPPLSLQPLGRALVADAEQIDLISVLGHDLGRPPDKRDSDARAQVGSPRPLAAQSHDEHHQPVIPR